MKLKPWLFFLLLAGCGDSVSTTPLALGETSNQIIYGEDSIRETDTGLDLQSQASVALMSKRNWELLQRNSPSLTIEEAYSVDSDMVWKDQPSYSHCTGVVITKDRIITANHCLSEISCEDTVVVFGYRKNSKKIEARSCAKLGIHRTDVQAGLDYAILKLDEEIEVKPVKIQTESIKVGTELLVVGFPLGASQKLSNGVVRTVEDNGNLNSNLDVFSGSSGSPVFDKKSGHLVGILIGGESDFEMDQKSGQEVMKRCSDTDCGGEIVTPIKKILADIKNQL